MEHVLKENPEVVVIRKGTSGMASLSDDRKALLEERGIEIIEADTPEIRDKFNEMALRCFVWVTQYPYYPLKQIT
ncbi:hypothetical protein C5S29_02920 [ANME-1 cluster archaeon GoMg3.2]|nr:hypothetical protein [ANME-1 cluster archaeon GoMg3.2]